MSNYSIAAHPPTTGNIIDQFEHTRIGQQVAYDIALNFTSVSDLMDHTRNTPHGAVTQLLTGDTVSYNVHRPKVRAVATAVASYFGWNPN